MPTMSRRLMASDPRLLTEIGIREQNRIRVDGSRTGTMLYGPYIPLPPGDYEATVRFDPAITPRGAATFDVAADIGRVVLASRQIVAERLIEQGMSASLSFSCRDRTKLHEVRLFCVSEFAAALQSVEIRGEILDAPDGAGFELGDFHPVDVRNEISRGRNPYEGYQRGLSLITDSMKKLRMDPAFQEAFDRAVGRTIVSENNLANIFLLIKFFAPRLPFGHIVEFGSYKGGSAIFMASLAQKFLPHVQVLAFDTFAGMPPTDKTIDLHNTGDFQGVDLPELRDYAEQIGLTNLRFVPGTFEATAAPALADLGTVSICHIDCDIRSAIQSAYEATRPHMVAGGYWVFDDPLQPTCLGATEAVEDLLIRRDALNAEQVWPHLVFRAPF